MNASYRETFQQLSPLFLLVWKMPINTRLPTRGFCNTVQIRHPGEICHASNQIYTKFYFSITESFQVMSLFCIFQKLASIVWQPLKSHNEICRQTLVEEELDGSLKTFPTFFILLLYTSKMFLAEIMNCAHAQIIFLLVEKVCMEPFYHKLVWSFKNLQKHN